MGNCHINKGFKPKGKSNKNENFVQIMKDGFTQVTKAFNKDLKKASQKSKRNANGAIPTAPEVLGRVVLGNM